jgi:hypothetical protein
MIYGGLVVVIAYASGSNLENEMWLITQSNLDILTQDSERILIQE